LLGAKYEFDDLESIEIAKKQALLVAGSLVEGGGPANLDDTKIVALIAYLQRLGADIMAPDTPPAPSAPAPAPGLADATAQAETTSAGEVAQ
jgi:hypothetical protein